MMHCGDQGGGWMSRRNDVETQRWSGQVGRTTENEALNCGSDQLLIDTVSEHQFIKRSKQKIRTLSF